MHEAATPAGHEPDAGDRGVWAAMVLATDIDACEALARGLPVPAQRLDPTLVARLGLTGEITMTDELALRVELARPTNGAQPDEDQGEWLKFVAARAFADIQEESAAPLLGDGVITAGSNVLIYGDGGAGKTSLELDAAVHLAAGEDWLGFTVPHPFTVAIVENEGPRGPFRAKLARKLDHWAKPVENLYILEEPWALLRLDRDDHLQAIRGWLGLNNVDILMLGPAVSSGFTGAGTPDDIELHAQRLQALRLTLDRPLSIWLIHHENKQGDVSGAWERLPDTFLRVRAGDGGGYTLIQWKKTRWSSEWHGKKMVLRWTDGDGYEVIDRDQAVARKTTEVYEAAHWLVDHVAAHPGIKQGDLEAAYVAEKDNVRGARARIREAVEKCLKPAWILNSPFAVQDGETDPLSANATKYITLGPGESPRGKYLYPASTLNPPFADTLFGESANTPPAMSQARPQNEHSPFAARSIESGVYGELASEPADTGENEEFPF